jgi:hypothetical protein
LVGKARHLARSCGLLHHACLSVKPRRMIRAKFGENVGIIFAKNLIIPNVCCKFRFEIYFLHHCFYIIVFTSLFLHY